MDLNPSDDWFDLVPSALAEFDEQGRWLRHNHAFAALVERAPTPGQHLATTASHIQQLTGWDTPLGLLGLRPGEGAFPTRVHVTRDDLVPCVLMGKVHAAASPAPGGERKLLCIAWSATPSTTSDITAQPHPALDTEPLLHELTTILESSPAGIAYLRADTLVRCNRRFERMLGVEPGTLTGQQLEALLSHDPRIKRVASESVARLQHEPQYESELEIDVPGKPTMWYALSIKRIGSAGGPLEAIAVLSDITRIRTQKAQLEAMGRDLALQADRTRAILDSVFVGIVTLDANGISWMNRSARRMFGGDLRDFVGQPLSTVATTDLDHPFRMTEYLDDLLDGQSHTFECQVMGRDGRIFWVVGNAVVTLGEFNQRQTTYALLDIDRRRQAEARSADAQATLKRIIEMAPMAISLLEASSLRVLQANKGAAGFLQRDPHQAVGEPPETLFPEARARQMREEMQSALDANAPVHREHKVGSGHGKGPFQIWDVNYLPLGSEDQAADQLLVVASDITEQRAAEKARLDAAIAQREMLVREVHHRIKNNLQGVAGLLQQIAQRKPEVAPAISEVVGQVQAIAQVYGLQVGAGGPLRLHSVVEAIASSVQKTFGHPIALTLEGPQVNDWQLPEAESIPIALSLNELLTNAHKHSDKGSPIACGMSSDEQGVTICIRNRGHVPEGFTMDRIRGGVSGLGLVRALLPRRSSSIQIQQDGAQVLTRLQLTPPGISLSPYPPNLGEPAGQQFALWPQ
jgi:hypothetical protein